MNARATSIEVRATNGSMLTIIGERRGPFLLHRDLTESLFGEDKIARLWSVTHETSGARFPFSFKTKKDAEKFAREVVPLMNWSSVNVEPTGDGPRTKWVSGKPTKKQVLAVRECARENGGVRSS